MLQSFTIALDPFGWHVGANPLGGNLREHVQDIDHGLSHTQGAIERTDSGQDMGRVGALPSMSGSAIHPPDTAPGGDLTDAVRHFPRPGGSETRRGRYGQSRDRKGPG